MTPVFVHKGRDNPGFSWTKEVTINISCDCERLPKNKCTEYRVVDVICIWKYSSSVWIRVAMIVMVDIEQLLRVYSCCCCMSSSLPTFLCCDHQPSTTHERVIGSWPPITCKKDVAHDLDKVALLSSIYWYRRGSNVFTCMCHDDTIVPVERSLYGHGRDIDISIRDYYSRQCFLSSDQSWTVSSI